MSLPNYLAKIKSAGVYRFVWDKSALPPQTAETLRLVIGYSDKGPFNTPVYIETTSDFLQIYGGVSKRLERNGVYFHRLALQALSAGPILAMNIKPFNEEKVDFCKFNPSEIDNYVKSDQDKVNVKDVYDTNRFWALDADKLPDKVKPEAKKYITIVPTDVKDNSCTMFMYPTKPASYEGITVRSWYNSQNLEIPEYLDSILDTNLDNYFMDIYVFRGEFTPAVVDGSLKDYFDIKYGEDGKPTGFSLKTEFEDTFGEKGGVEDVLKALSEDSNSNFLGAYSGCTIPYFKDANGNYISLDIKFNMDNSSHKMLMKMNETMLEEMSQNIISTENIKSPCMIYLKGYTYKSLTDNDGKRFSGQKLQDEIFKVLNYKGIRTALTNRVDIEYHYIVDTFESYIEQRCKSKLVSLAKEKDNAFAILNFPKMSSFTSNDSYKKPNTESTGSFDIKMVADKAKGFSLPTEVNGASWGGFFTQLTFSDGTLKSVIPSAALVSNNFMEKWGARQPYYIVAGPIYGQLQYDGLVGPDYNFGRSDLDVLEPMGVNAIIYVPRKGTYINSNQTAKQVPVSALSKIHIRELVIYLQNEIENLLQSYQWELNTQTLRDTIRSKADAICETIMNNGGLYAFRNICDETNNTPEVIDNEMIILDTEIEPARGAGKMVHQLTIHKTGAMSSTVK